MTEIVAQKRKTDDPEIWKDNSVEIFLNPSGDRKTCFQILINSEGALSDQKIVRHGASGSSDFSWNSGAVPNVEKGNSFWSAIVTIPLKNLPGIRDEFPANFARNRILKTSSGYQTLYHWSPFARGFHDLENFGTISLAPDRNILINGDFSLPAQRTKRHFGIWEKNRWVGGWIGDSSLSARCDETQFVSAPAAMRLSGKNRILTQYLPKLKANRKYRLSFYVKLENVKPVGQGGVCANLWDDRNRWFPAHNYLSGSTDWIFQSFTFTTGEKTGLQGKTIPYLRLRIMNAEGTAWFDDVRLEEL